MLLAVHQLDEHRHGAAHGAAAPLGVEGVHALPDLLAPGAGSIEAQISRLGQALNAGEGHGVRVLDQYGVRHILGLDPAAAAVEGQIERREIVIRTRDCDIAHVRVDELCAYLSVARRAAHIGRGRLAGRSFIGEPAVVGEVDIRQEVVVRHAEDGDGRVVLVYRAAGDGVYLIFSAQGDFHVVPLGVGGVHGGKAVIGHVDREAVVVIGVKGAIKQHAGGDVRPAVLPGEAAVDILRQLEEAVHDFVVIRHGDRGAAAALRALKLERAAQKEVAGGLPGVEHQAPALRAEGEALAAVRDKRQSAVRRGGVAALYGLGQQRAAREGEAAVLIKAQHGAERGEVAVASGDVGIVVAGALRCELQRREQGEGGPVIDGAAAARLGVIAHRVRGGGEENERAFPELKGVVCAAAAEEADGAAVHGVFARCDIVLAEAEVELKAAVVLQHELRDAGARAVEDVYAGGKAAVRLGAGEGAGGGEGNYQEDRDEGNRRVFRLFHYHFHPFAYISPASGHRCRRAEQVARPALWGDEPHEREPVAVALGLAEALYGDLVAGELAVGLRHGCAYIDYGVPPVEHEAERAEQRPDVVAAAVVRALVREDVAQGLFVRGHLWRDVYRRVRQAEDAGRAEPLRLIDRETAVAEEEFPSPAQRAGAGDVYKDKVAARDHAAGCVERREQCARVRPARGAFLFGGGRGGDARVRAHGGFAAHRRLLSGPAGNRGGGCRGLRVGAGHGVLPRDGRRRGIGCFNRGGACALARRRSDALARRGDGGGSAVFRLRRVDGGGGERVVLRRLRNVWARVFRRGGQGVHQRDRARGERKGQQQPDERDRPQRRAEAVCEVRSEKRADYEQQHYERRARNCRLNHAAQPPFPPGGGSQPARLSPRGSARGSRPCSSSWSRDCRRIPGRGRSAFHSARRRRGLSSHCIAWETLSRRSSPRPFPSAGRAL